MQIQRRYNQKVVVLVISVLFLQQLEFRIPFVPSLFFFPGITHTEKKTEGKRENE